MMIDRKIAASDDAELRVLSEQEAARRMLLAYRTLQQHRREGRGPRYIELPSGRIGYLASDLRVWLDQRARAGSWYPRGVRTEIAA